MQSMVRTQVYGLGKNKVKPVDVADCRGLSGSTAESIATYYTHEGNGGDKLE